MYLVLPARRRALAISLALALAAVLLPLHTAPPAGAQTVEQIDIAFALDGSGSISSTDWALQRDGFSAALQDPAAFPLDGSVRVAVVQWANGATRVEVPLTPVTDAGARDALVGQIQAISQFQGLTNPGDGLRRAADVLAADPREDATRTVCMSTDGTTNSGESLGTAGAHAQAVGTDRYSVIGIQDGAFTEAQAHAHYGPHVFGGGAVTFARNTTEFTSLIIGSCLNDPVELVGLEVNQAIQSWTNDVPLTTYKRTVVRAFLQVREDGDTERVSGRLHGERGGVPLPGSPIAASNTAGSVLVDEDVTERRGKLDASLNFELPRSWTEGTVTLRVDGGGTALDCLEVAGPDPEDCATTVTFDEVPRRDVKLVGVEYADGDDTVAPSTTQVFEHGFRTESLLPVDRLGLSFGELRAGFTDPPDVFDVNRQLGRMRLLDLCGPSQGCDRLYYGVLLGEPAPDQAGGAANGIPGTVASGYTYDVNGRGDTGFFRNIAGHEIGHALGLHHAVDNELGTSDGLKVGHCSEQADASAPGHPWFDTLRGPAGTTTGPLLGPLGEPDTEMWGLDTRFTRADVNRLAVVDPNVTGALLGYCWVGSPQDLWTSAFEWGLLRTSLGAAAAGTDSAADLEAADTTTGRHLVVSGTVDLDADPVTATFDPVLVLDATLPTTTGAYTLRVSDDGTVVAEAAFDVEELHTRPGTPGGHGQHGERGIFTVPVAVGDASYDTIEVVRGSQVLGAVTASANAPEVEVTAPAGGSVEDGDTVRIAWDATDADGDELRATVRLRSGDDTTWQTLGVDLDATELVVDRDTLGGGDAAIVEVIVSDGVLATAARSAPFQLTDPGPTIAIRTPVDGDTFYSGIQPVTLEATAIDRIDGEIERIEWRSDLDGVLGTGTSVTRTADTLSVGTHVLTATATNSRGVVGSAEVEVSVVRVAPPPVPDVSFGSVRALLERYVAEGRVTTAVARSVTIRLDTAERFHDDGQDRQRDRQLEAIVTSLQSQAGGARDPQPLRDVAREVSDLLAHLRG